MTWAGTDAPSRFPMESWIEQYNASRYLRKQPDAALDARFDVLANNFWNTDEHLKVVQLRNGLQFETVLKALTDIATERHLRNGMPVVIDTKDIRTHGSARYIPPKLISPFRGTPEGFAKFGARRYIRDAFEHGRLYIQPASAFSDPSLNPAQRDDELNHWTIVPEQHIEMRIIGIGPDGKEGLVPFQHGNQLRGKVVRDFYVWCCGWGCDARLFHDFTANAVLLVRDTEEFRRRFLIAMRSLLPDWDPFDRVMFYYDPLLVRHDQIVPMFSKNMRFLYQNEYRFAWRAPPGAGPTGPLFPVLGPLTDIAEYYELDDGSVA